MKTEGIRMTTPETVPEGSFQEDFTNETLYLAILEKLERFDAVIEEIQTSRKELEKHFGDVIQEIKARRDTLQNTLDELVKEMRDSNQLSRDRKVLAEKNLVLAEKNLNALDTHSTKSLAGQEEIKTAIDTHTEVMNKTWNDCASRVESATYNLRRFIDNSTNVQEYETTHKLARLVPEGEVVTYSYDLFNEEGEKLVDIDGMVVGNWRGREVIIFLEAKSFLNSISLCKDAVGQLGCIEDYWEGLVYGYPNGFSAEHGDKHKYKAYTDLKVELNRGREVFFAFASNFYSESAINFFRRQRVKPICLTSNWDQKLQILDLYG